MDILGSLKSAYDLVKGIQADVKEAALQRTVSELLAQLNDVSSQLGDVLTARLALQEENERLRRENDQLKQWDQEKEQYVLKQLGTGGYVYAPNASGEKGEGEVNKGPYLCTACYEQKKKSILQFVSLGFDGTHYQCPFCKTKVVDSGKKAGEDIWPGSPRTNWDGFI